MGRLINAVTNCQWQCSALIILLFIFLTHLTILNHMFSSVILNNSNKSLSNSRVVPLPQNQPLDTYLRKKSQQYFFKLASQQLTEQEMRVQFSKDILTHFLTNLPSNIISQTHIQDIQQHLKQNMKFLKTMYPQPKASVLSRNIFQGLKQANISDKVQFDLLSNLDTKFEPKGQQISRMQILTQIQDIFNSIIKSSQKAVTEYTNLLMNQIPKKLNAQSKSKYQYLMKQPWKFDLQNDITKTHIYHKELISQRLFFTSIELFKVVLMWVEHLQQIVVEPDAYFEKTEFLKVVNSGRQNQGRLRNIRNQAKIFNKFPTTADSGSSRQQQAQINSKKQVTTTAQNPEQQWFFTRIFNKVRKMCNGEQDISEPFQRIEMKYKYEPLEQSTYQNTSQPSIENTQNYTNFAFKNSGYLYKHYIQSLEQLRAQVNYSKFCDEQLEFLRKGYIQTVRVVDKNKIKQKYTIEEKKVYSFCQNSYFFMEEVLIQRLVKLVNTFLRLKQKSQSQYQKCMVFQDVDLIKFNQDSIVSAFIVADQKMLMDVYNSIIQLTSTRQAKIAKVENRFGTAYNDAIIVLKIKNNPILCKLRLCLQQQRTGPQSKQKALCQMHAFLNEMQKFSYGPISYLSLILATKDHRVNYLQSIRKPHLQGNVKLSQVCHCGKGNVSERSSVNTFEKQIKSIITDEGTIKLDCYRNLIPTSFVCGVCEKVVKKGQSVIPVPSCTECGFHICVQCSFENAPQTQRDIYASLMNSVAKIVDPCYFSQLELSDPTKKNYNHSYTKDVQIIANGKPEIKKQVHYHIVLEGSNFVRYGKYTKQNEFWQELKDKINLKNIQEYKGVIKQDKFVGVLFRPRELLREKGQPFTFIIYDCTANKFAKFVHKVGQQRATQTPVTFKQLNMSENDAFLPILWIFGESLVTEYITKVLQTNPFCVKRSPIRDLSMDHMRFSRSKISSHHIMR